MSYITSADGTLVIKMISQLSHDIIGRWGLMVIGYKDVRAISAFDPSLLLVKFSVFQSFYHCQFCSGPS